MNQLSTLLISLEVTVKFLDKEKHNVIRGRTIDHLDSVNNKIERLQSLKERLGRKLDKIAKKGAIRLVHPGTKKKARLFFMEARGLKYTALVTVRFSVRKRQEAFLIGTFQSSLHPTYRSQQS